MKYEADSISKNINLSKILNILKTTILMLVTMILFIIVGYIINDVYGCFVAICIAFFVNIFIYWFSDKVILRAMKAKKMDQNTAPHLYKIMKELSKKAELPVPKIYLINEKLPNAFATGRNKKFAAIGLTTGLLEILSDSELKGVIGHELAHIQHMDILTSTVMTMIVHAISILSNFKKFSRFHRNNSHNTRNSFISFIAIFLSPIIATIIQLALSREREYIADHNGAKICDDPIALANALKKIHNYTHLQSTGNTTEFAQMMIINHFSKKTDFSFLFSTHPPIEKRIDKLLAMKK